MQTWTDQVANVHGRVDAKSQSAPALLLGSHYDTVKDAGRFDGAMGILVAIAAVKASILQVSTWYAWLQQHFAQADGTQVPLARVYTLTLRPADCTLKQ